jgi:hypothetical protein
MINLSSDAWSLEVSMRRIVHLQLGVALDSRIPRLRRMLDRCVGID